MKIRKLLMISLWIYPAFSIAHAAVKKTQPEDEFPNPLPSPSHRARATEWQNLPPQSWEVKKSVTSSDDVRAGVDLRSVAVPKLKIYESSNYIIHPRKIQAFGKIIGSPSDFETLSTNELVTIQATDDIQLGETYSVVSDEPLQLLNRSAKRGGSVYPVLGKVKVTGMQENLYIGTILSLQRPLRRGCLLTIGPPKSTTPALIPGPHPVRASIMLDPQGFSQFLSPNTEIFLNRGSEDGVQPGMVFRVYQKEDPRTHKPYSASSFVIDADLLVTQVT